jgi:hypothetical protein
MGARVASARAQIDLLAAQSAFPRIIAEKRENSAFQEALPVEPAALFPGTIATLPLHLFTTPLELR